MSPRRDEDHDVSRRDVADLAEDCGEHLAPGLRARAVADRDRNALPRAYRFAKRRPIERRAQRRSQRADRVGHAIPELGFDHRRATGWDLDIEAAVAIRESYLHLSLRRAGRDEGGNR